ncbi:duf814 domain containing protein [Ophiocordyceps sinensis CO18]|uniref:Duf814 domain containing protein n=1 Tax=Ophiocordyceps sinensis (strain Co18 / CGMCC 3.14243) TaxID=911162 RepID=T5AKN1_OPHSC|nr:duf814 domain containing protein [Ophiocordyceps sinensis CO18]
MASLTCTKYEVLSSHLETPPDTVPTLFSPFLSNQRRHHRKKPYSSSALAVARPPPPPASPPSSVRKPLSQAGPGPPKASMVYYFTSAVVDPPAFVYVGKDKFENEDLIKFGWDQDVWCFHVDKLSSAHIYLRMQDGQSWDALPEALVADLAQLTKANSIEGSFFLSLSLAPPATTN